MSEVVVTAPPAPPAAAVCLLSTGIHPSNTWTGEKYAGDERREKRKAGKGMDDDDDDGDEEGEHLVNMIR